MCYLFEGVSMGALMCVHMESVKIKSKRRKLPKSIQAGKPSPYGTDYDEEMSDQNFLILDRISSDDTESDQSVSLASPHNDARAD